MKAQISNLLNMNSDRKFFCFYCRCFFSFFITVIMISSTSISISIIIFLFVHVVHVLWLVCTNSLSDS